METVEMICTVILILVVFGLGFVGLAACFLAVARIDETKKRIMNEHTTKDRGASPAVFFIF
ncbi:MAG: hypothetical protein WCT18_02120 [Patescibacteria group bacterium]